MVRAVVLSAVVVLLLLVACSGDDDMTSIATATPTATAFPTPTSTAMPTSMPVASDCDASGLGGLSVGDVVPEAFVCIELPLPGDSMTGPIVVSGWSAGAFEASLIVELLDGDGSILSRLPTMVAQPEIGLFAGEFAITLAMEDAPRFEGGSIHVWAQSPRDGSIAFETTIELAFRP